MASDIAQPWSWGLVIEERKAPYTKQISSKQNVTQWFSSGESKAGRSASADTCKYFGNPWWIDRWGDLSCREPTCSTLMDAPETVGSFIASLGTCIREKDLVRGATIHLQLVENHSVAKCSDSLVTMYATCGEMEKAKSLFDVHNTKDVITWTALIAGYVRKGQCEIALHLFEDMQKKGIFPNAVTYTCVLKACAMTKAVNLGKRIHDEIARQGLLQTDLVLGGALLDMYVKCRAFPEAHCVLEELPSRNVICWNTLMTGYAQEGEAEQVLNCIKQMVHEGTCPDAVTYACILKACAILRDIHKGRQIYQDIVRHGLLQNDVVLSNALIDMYVKCDLVLEAQYVLKNLACRDVVSWNSLIAGFAQRREAEEAWSCLEDMRQEGILPNTVTYICALKACASSTSGERGEQLHDEIMRQGLLFKDVVLGNALVDMYAKCGNIAKAHRVLKELPHRNVASWNALISGYAQQGKVEQTMNCLKLMQHEGIHPNAVTYICTLKACAESKAVSLGEQIHGLIATTGLLQNDKALGNALVDMYVKCDALSKARQLLESLPSRDVVSWSALICGHAHRGDAEQALICFEEMLLEGILPDEVTYTAVLNVCSHRGLVEEGQLIFMNMVRKFHVKPSIECCNVMIDLLGRAGHLEKAASFIQKMPTSDHLAIWHALLGACQKWVDVDVGRWAFEEIVKLDKSDGSAYILMASIYTAAGMLEKARCIESMRIRNEAGSQRG